MADAQTPNGNCIGIDLGGTNLQAALLDDAHQIVARTHVQTLAKEGPNAVIGRIAHAAQLVADEAGVTLNDVGAIGVAAPGVIELATGVVTNAPNLGWKHVPLREQLATMLDRPVFVDNDVNAAAWGEFVAGAGADDDDMLGIWVGTGVGGGIVLGGQLVSGRAFSAAEIGRTVFDAHGVPGARVLEHHASRLGMSRLIDEWSDDHQDSELPGHADAHGVVASHALAAAFEQQDALATRVVAHGAKALGVAIANIVTLLGMGAVVIGGGVTETLGTPYLDMIESSFRESVFPPDARCALRMTTLGPDAGLIGAALLALH